MQEKKADKKSDGSNENLVENVDKDAFDDKKEEEIKEEPTYDELLEELNLLKDRLMRALADSENTRKRAERDRKDAELYGGTKLARDLLSVYDNLSRALDNINAELTEIAGPLVNGLELTQRELLSVFSRHKIEKINPDEGERFDPKFHQAMFESPVPGTEKGTIIQVMTEGFKIGDRLLRASQVGVSSNNLVNKGEQDSGGQDLKNGQEIQEN